MAEQASIEQMVARVVSQALAGHLPPLQEKLVQAVIGELKAQMPPPETLEGSTDLGSASPQRASDAGALLGAVSAIHAGTSQKDILRALLDSTTGYSGRAALFVIKAGAATGWQARGFGPPHQGNEQIKDFSFDVSRGASASALRSRTPARGDTGEMDPRFTSHFGAPADRQGLVLPLLLKDKVAALVYVDGGSNPEGILNPQAIELLVSATSAWLEVISLRKQAQKDGIGESVAAEPTPPPAPAISDPFAAHSPRHAAVEPAPFGEPMGLAAAAGASGADSRATVQAQPVSFSSAASLEQTSSPEAEVHRKAQRFARLLMDEIKLYNQAKVIEGRKNRDLYDRLQEDIEKSRLSYQKRYAGTSAGSADYFNQELIHGLAEDDISLLGQNFHR